MKRALALLLALLSLLWAGSAGAVTSTQLIDGASTGQTPFQSLFSGVQFDFTADSIQWTVDPIAFQARYRAEYAVYLEKTAVGCTWFDFTVSLCQSKTKTGPVHWIGPGFCAAIKSSTYYGQPFYIVTRSVPSGSTQTGFDTPPDAYAYAIGSVPLWGAAMWKTQELQGSCSGANTDGAFPTAAGFNDLLVSSLVTVLNDKRPSVSVLVQDWGFSASGQYLDEGYAAAPGGGGSTDPTDPGTGTPGTGTPGTSTPTTCLTPGGEPTTNQFECVGSDEQTSCNFLNIPCNFRFLFIPDPVAVEAMFSATNITQTLNLPIQAVRSTRFNVCFGLDWTSCSGEGENASGTRWFTVQWDMYVIPPAVVNMIAFIFWLGAASFILGYLGLPNPFGRRASPDQSTGQQGNPTENWSNKVSGGNGGGFGGRSKK